MRRQPLAWNANRHRYTFAMGNTLLSTYCVSKIAHSNSEYEECRAEQLRPRWNIARAFKRTLTPWTTDGDPYPYRNELPRKHVKTCHPLICRRILIILQKDYVYGPICGTEGGAANFILGMYHLAASDSRPIQLYWSFLVNQTCDSLTKRLPEFCRTIKAEDEVFVYYAGHGTSIWTSPCFVSVDNHKRTCSLHIEDVLDYISRRNPQFTFVLLDAVNSYDTRTHCVRASSFGFHSSFNIVGDKVLILKAESPCSEDPQAKKKSLLTSYSLESHKMDDHFMYREYGPSLQSKFMYDAMSMHHNEDFSDDELEHHVALDVAIRRPKLLDTNMTGVSSQKRSFSPKSCHPEMEYVPTNMNRLYREGPSHNALLDIACEEFLERSDSPTMVCSTVPSPSFKIDTSTEDTVSGGLVSNGVSVSEPCNENQCITDNSHGCIGFQLKENTFRNAYFVYRSNANLRGRLETSAAELKEASRSSAASFPSIHFSDVVSMISTPAYLQLYPPSVYPSSCSPRHNDASLLGLPERARKPLEHGSPNRGCSTRFDHLNRNQYQLRDGNQSPSNLNVQIAPDVLCFLNELVPADVLSSSGLENDIPLHKSTVAYYPSLGVVVPSSFLPAAVARCFQGESETSQQNLTVDTFLSRLQKISMHHTLEVPFHWMYSNFSPFSLRVCAQ